MTGLDALALVLSLAALGSPLPPVRAEGVATVYFPGDGHSGDTLGCPAAARRLYGSARFTDGVPVVAMRPGEGPPCGTRVVVEHRGRRAAAVRLDSGPYGADCDGTRRVIRGPLPAGCRWRGIADLSRPVARAVGLRGRGYVRIRWAR